MSVILTIYHVIGIIVGFATILGTFMKFYTKAVKTEIQNTWQQEIAKTREAMDAVNERRIVEIHKKIDKECSTESIKGKVRDLVDGKLQLMEQDVRQIKELSVDLKGLLGTQQETLIAIQMSIADLKPRISNLEDRVQKLETKNDKS